MARPRKPDWVVKADDIIAKSAYAMILMGYPAHPREQYYYDKFPNRYVFSVLCQVSFDLLKRTSNPMQNQDDPFWSLGKQMSPDSIKKIFEQWMGVNKCLFRANLFRKDSYELANRNGQGLGEYDLTDIASELVSNEGFLADKFCWVDGVKRRYLEIYRPVPLDMTDVFRVESVDPMRDYGRYVNLPEGLVFLIDVLERGHEVKFSGDVF